MALSQQLLVRDLSKLYAHDLVDVVYEAGPRHTNGSHFGFYVNGPNPTVLDPMKFVGHTNVVAHSNAETARVR